MSNIPITQNPDFNQDMTSLETSTPAHADIFNSMFKQCIENDVANRRDAKIFEDVVTSKKCKIGVENGLIFIEYEDRE